MIKINRERLNEFLQFKRWRRTDLAKAMGFTESYITRLLDGDREPSAEVMERLHIVSGLPLDELFFCSESPQMGRFTKK